MCCSIDVINYLIGSNILSNLINKISEREMHGCGFHWYSRENFFFFLFDKSVKINRCVQEHQTSSTSALLIQYSNEQSSKGMNILTNHCQMTLKQPVKRFFSR